MHMCGAARPKLRHLHPPVFRKMRRHNFVGVLNLTPRRNLHGLGHLHHEIRVRNIPSFSPFPRCRRIFRIPRRSPSFGPRHNRRNLLLGQRSIVGKMPIPRIGKPRRHHLHFDRMRHRPGPRTRLLVGHEWHRRNFSRPMATLTMILQDRNHIFIERRRRGRSRLLQTSPAKTDR